MLRTNLAVALLSAAVGVLLSEAILRAALDPLNFLTPTRIPDPILGWRIEPGSAGHDQWGFRNSEVPEAVGRVALGDSQTYGDGASADSSWPAWLERLSGKRVYNLGLGGYGPVEYRYLLVDKALKLHPSLIIVGLYFGNDLFDAQQATYSRDYWSFLRDPAFPRQPAAGSATMELDGVPSPSRGIALRTWLRKHSMLYRITTLLFSERLRPIEFRYFSRSSDDLTVVRDEEGSLVTVINSAGRFPAVNLDDPRIWEGLRLTLDALAEMQLACRASDAELVVLLIPTKESVFHDYVQARGIETMREQRSQLVSNEAFLRGRVIAGLESSGIAYVDALPALRRATGVAPIYHQNADGHATREGNRVIAETLARHLDGRSVQHAGFRDSQGW